MLSFLERRMPGDTANVLGFLMAYKEKKI